MIDSEIRQVKHKTLRGLIDYWLEKRGDRAMPSRADIDPVEIPWALSCIWLCDYRPAERRFRYRLAGEQINEFWGSAVGGRYLDELVPGPCLAEVERCLSAVYEGPSVVHDFGRIYLEDEVFATGERIILPLSDDGKTVDGLLGASCRNWFRDLTQDGKLDTRQTSTVTPLHAAAAARRADCSTLNFSP